MITAATARELGLEVTAEAAVHSIDGLVDAVVDAVSGVGVGVVPGGSDAR